MLGASSGVFLGEPESTFRIALARLGVLRLQRFADFQGSGWKLASFLQWSSNVVTALANGKLFTVVLSKDNSYTDIS
jgi:hypothetical protein